MTIEARTSGAVTILDVGGRLTIETLGAMTLAENVRPLLLAGRKQILLNLEGVPYVDTMGVCNIVEAYIATQRQGGSLKLLHLKPHVRELLRITRLLTVFDAYDSEADAVASFGPVASALSRKGYHRRGS
jgi:anti-sigma B factor antagonist